MRINNFVYIFNILMITSCWFLFCFFAGWVNKYVGNRYSADLPVYTIRRDLNNLR